MLCLQHLEGYLVQGKSYNVYGLYCQVNQNAGVSGPVTEEKWVMPREPVGLAKMLLRKDADSTRTWCSESISGKGLWTLRV